MNITDEQTTDGVIQRRFEMTLEDQCVPGMHWLPEAATGPCTTILIGHGGFQSKEAPNIVAMAAQMATERGYATIALDAPGHGDRRTEEQIQQQEATLRRLRSEGVTPEARQSRDRVVESATTTPKVDEPRREPRMVREWKALLDHLGDNPELANGTYGYWGVSMGARYGIPLIATEPRISAAVLGLYGLAGDGSFKATVESITIPLLFLFQYHDELMTPESGLALFAAFGSKEKTMHINPGPHVGIPTFERDASATFFARHLS